jgi:hypothetical protein
MRMQSSNQKEVPALLTGPAGVWPFPVAKVVIVVVLIRQLSKIAEAQGQQDAAAN